VRSNTFITLGASAAFGIMAVLLARGWINDAVRSEFSQAPLQNSQKLIAPDSQPVIIADIALGFGDILNAQALRIVDYPADAIPAGAFSSFENLFSDPNFTTLVLSPIGINEPILAHKINGQGGRGSLSAIIDEGMRAVSVRMNDVDGVAGFVLPGDYIDVIYTHDAEVRVPAAGQNLRADILLQNIKVLGIDQNLNVESAAPEIPKTVTLEVTNAQAQKLNLAMDAGRLSLTLRRAGEKDIQSAPSMALKDITSTQKPKKRRQYVKKSKPVIKDKSGTTQVTIIRGESRDAVNVVSENTYSENSQTQEPGLQILELAGG